MIQFSTIENQMLDALRNPNSAEDRGLRLIGQIGSFYTYAWDERPRGDGVPAIIATPYLVSCTRAAARHFRLSPTQMQVATLIGYRRSNSEIAETLCISPNTARRHTELVMLKLGVTSRLEVERVLRDFQVGRVDAGTR